MPMKPFRTNEPNNQDAISDSVKPPFRPTPSIIATGAEAAKRNAIIALLIWIREISFQILFSVGRGYWIGSKFKGSSGLIIDTLDTNYTAFKEHTIRNVAFTDMAFFQFWLLI